MRIVLTMLMLASLGGCTALMVGGAAAGGYQLGKDERTPSQVTADAATTAAVKSRLAADSTVSAFAVNVDTYADRVTLSGTVGSHDARRRAAEIAAGVERVVSVNNQLRVSGSR